MMTSPPFADPRAARRWCERVAGDVVERQVIQRQGAPYLERYFLAGWSPMRPVPGPALYLHHFVASDPDDQVHSHPWAWSSSLILVGGYREYRCDAQGQAVVRCYAPGDVNYLAAADRHRIELVERDAWTLFLVAEYQQPWMFTPMCEGGVQNVSHG